MNSIFLCDAQGVVQQVYAQGIKERMEHQIGIEPYVFEKKDILANPERFRNVSIIFSTWGMTEFSEVEVKHCFPNLKAIFYAGGSVNHFAEPFLKQGVKVFSAWRANGIPVAEYTVASIVLANKGFFHTSRRMKAGDWQESREIAVQYPGNYGETVGLIGCGVIGSTVAQMLKQYRVHVAVYDPFLSEERAVQLGVEKMNLQELFVKSQVVSNHLPDNEITRGMLGRELFETMKPYSTFINTGRGAQVIEDELVDVLLARPDLTAILDVTHPEPPIEKHAFYNLPNCVLTPHIAGSSGNEVCRMAEMMESSYEKYLLGKNDECEITLEMLSLMA